MLNSLESDRTTQFIWAGCLLAPQLLAMASTIFRFIHRKRNQGLWWDDHLALVALALAFIFFVTPWFALVQAQPTLQIVAGWLFTLSFPILIWTCRISLALSIGRIMPRQHPIFSLVLYLIFFFGAICLALVIQLTVACGRNTSWTHTPPYIYIPTRSTAIFILSGDLVGDILLVTIPLYLFWNAKLQPVELLLVKIGFAASVLTSASSIITASFFLTHVGTGSNKRIILTGLTHILGCFSLMACNALVIITFLYRYFWRQEEEQPIALVNTPIPVTRDQYTLTNRSEPTTSSYALTDLSDMMGGRHTFSCNYESHPHLYWEKTI